MTDTSDESLINATKSLVIGATANRNACGPRIAKESRELLRLTVVPHIRGSKHFLERTVTHARQKNSVRGIAKSRVALTEDIDVVPDRYRRILNDKPAGAPQRPLGNDVVE